MLRRNESASVRIPSRKRVLFEPPKSETSGTISELFEFGQETMKHFLKLFLATLMIFGSNFTFALSQSGEDNELIKLGRQQLEMPETIDLDFDELSRFTKALYHHRVVLSEITARLFLEKEDRVSLLEEMVERNNVIFERYNIEAERVAILERVLFKIPEMTDYIKYVAQSIDPEIIKRSKMPKTEEDLRFILEGKVGYSVNEALKSIKNVIGQTSSRGPASDLNNQP